MRGIAFHGISVVYCAGSPFFPGEITIRTAQPQTGTREGIRHRRRHRRARERRRVRGLAGHGGHGRIPPCERVGVLRIRSLRPVGVRRGRTVGNRRRVVDRAVAVRVPRNGVEAGRLVELRGVGGIGRDRRGDGGGPCVIKGISIFGGLGFGRGRAGVARGRRAAGEARNRLERRAVVVGINHRVGDGGRNRERAGHGGDGVVGGDIDAGSVNRGGRSDGIGPGGFTHRARIRIGNRLASRKGAGGDGGGERRIGVARGLRGIARRDGEGAGGNRPGNGLGGGGAVAPFVVLGQCRRRRVTARARGGVVRQRVARARRDARLHRAVVGQGARGHRNVNGLDQREIRRVVVVAVAVVNRCVVIVTKLGNIDADSVGADIEIRQIGIPDVFAPKHVRAAIPRAIGNREFVVPVFMGVFDVIEAVMQDGQVLRGIAFIPVPQFGPEGQIGDLTQLGPVGITGRLHIRIGTGVPRAVEHVVTVAETIPESRFGNRGGSEKSQ